MANRTCAGAVPRPWDILLEGMETRDNGRKMTQDWNQTFQPGLWGQSSAQMDPRGHRAFQEIPGQNREIQEMFKAQLEVTRTLSQSIMEWNQLIAGSNVPRSAEGPIISIKAPPFKRRFKGESDYEIRDFLKDFETHYRKCSDQEKRDQLRSHLGKRAVQYYDNEEIAFQNCESFEETKQKLIEYFDDDEDALQKFSTRTQRSDEDPLDFVQAKRKLANLAKVNSTEAQLVRSIVMGLAPEYLAQVINNRDSTIKELIESVKNAKLAVAATSKGRNSFLAVNHYTGQESSLESRVKATENTLATLVAAVDSNRAETERNSRALNAMRQDLARGVDALVAAEKRLREATSGDALYQGQQQMAGMPFKKRKWTRSQEANPAELCRWNGNANQAVLRAQPVNPHLSQQSSIQQNHDPSISTIKSRDNFVTKIYPRSDFPVKNEGHKSFAETNEKILDKSAYDSPDSDTVDQEPIYIRSVNFMQDKNFEQEVYSNDKFSSKFKEVTEQARSLSDFNDSNVGSNASLSSVSDSCEEIGASKGIVEPVTERGDPDAFKSCKSEEESAPCEIQEGDPHNIQIFPEEFVSSTEENRKNDHFDQQESGKEASKFGNEVEMLTVTSDGLELAYGLRVSGKQGEVSNFQNTDTAGRAVYKFERVSKKKRGYSTANYTDDAKSEFKKKICLKNNGYFNGHNSDHDFSWRSPKNWRFRRKFDPGE
ncbi:uncharacterized protein [Bemisia tabaci]|uniref:uncharacterized protein n=1 Tax=Bemisia tabaci TaxID=7038 RepID=UPI003B286DB6